jgi:hypothetical protein
MPASQALLSPDCHAQDPATHGTDESPDYDLRALRLVAVPDFGPPFDDEPAAKIAASGHFCRNLAFPDPGTGVIPRDTAAAPQMERLAIGEWPQQFARLLTEALAGARPVRQILPWTSERAHSHLRRLMPLFGGGQRPRVLRVIATRPTREVIEMTVIVGVGARTRALAIRLEQATPRPLYTPRGPGTPDDKATPGPLRWVCTDIEAA